MGIVCQVQLYHLISWIFGPILWFSSNIWRSLLLLYVDDIIIISDNVQGSKDLKHFLLVEVSSSSNVSYNTQAKYTSNLISWAGITDSKITHTLIDYNTCSNAHDN